MGGWTWCVQAEACAGEEFEDHSVFCMSCPISRTVISLRSHVMGFCHGGAACRALAASTVAAIILAHTP